MAASRYARQSMDPLPIAPKIDYQRSNLPPKTAPVRKHTLMRASSATQPNTTIDTMVSVRNPPSRQQFGSSQRLAATQHIHHYHDERPHIHKVDRVNFKPEALDHNRPPEVWHGIPQVTNTRYVEKPVIREVEQIIEVPREIEEIVYVDEPYVEVEEVPEYIPVVVSHRTVPRESRDKVKIVEEVQWEPEVLYDATQDDRWVEERRRRIEATGTAKQMTVCGSHLSATNKVEKTAVYGGTGDFCPHVAQPAVAEAAPAVIDYDSEGSPPAMPDPPELTIVGQVNEVPSKTTSSRSIAGVPSRIPSVVPAAETITTINRSPSNRVKAKTPPPYTITPLDIGDTKNVTRSSTDPVRPRVDVD